MILCFIFCTSPPWLLVWSYKDDVFFLNVCPVHNACFVSGIVIIP